MRLPSPSLSLVAFLLSSCATDPLPAPGGWDRGPARILRTVRGEGPLLAGAASLPLDPPYSVPMGGYFGGSELLLREQRDPLAARALVLEAGGLRVALLALDLVFIPPELRPAIEAKAGFREAGISAWTVFATHDHSAPGAYVRSWAAQRFGLGTYDPLIFRFIVERSAGALAAAARGLGPAAATHGSAAPAPGEPALSFNRKIPGAKVDQTVRALGLRRAGGDSRGAPLARLVTFAAHPTLVDPTERLASADFPGVLRRALDADGSLTIFLNGPSGDIAAGLTRKDTRAFWERHMEAIGRRLAGLAGEALLAAPAAKVGDTVLACTEGEILLPPRRPWRVPFIGRAIARNYPDRVRARCLRVGDLGLVFFPGELGSDLGEKVRMDLLSGSTLREVWVGTLADDYLGYAFSTEQYRSGGMSQHLTIYGEELGDLLRARLSEIGRECFR